jgi:hypothetical protein
VGGQVPDGSLAATCESCDGAVLWVKAYPVGNCDLAFVREDLDGTAIDKVVAATVNAAFRQIAYIVFIISLAITRRTAERRTSNIPTQNGSMPSRPHVPARTLPNQTSHSSSVGCSMFDFDVGRSTFRSNFSFIFGSTFDVGRSSTLDVRLATPFR